VTLTGTTTVFTREEKIGRSGIEVNSECRRANCDLPISETVGSLQGSTTRLTSIVTRGADTGTWVSLARVLLESSERMCIFTAEVY
jgi:hypothetical protein